MVVLSTVLFCNVHTLQCSQTATMFTLYTVCLAPRPVIPQHLRVMLVIEILIINRFVWTGRSASTGLFIGASREQYAARCGGGRALFPFTNCISLWRTCRFSRVSASCLGLTTPLLPTWRHASTANAAACPTAAASAHQVNHHAPAVAILYKPVSDPKPSNI